MASYNQAQYVRLRNLTSGGTSRDDEVAEVVGSVKNMVGKPTRWLHQARSKTMLLLLSLLLNIIGGSKMLLSKSPRDQILTYCKAFND